MEFKDYEKNLEELKAILSRLESGELSLDENLNEYKKGMQLYSELDACLRRSKGELLKMEGELALPFQREGMENDRLFNDNPEEPTAF